MKNWTGAGLLAIAVICCLAQPLAAADYPMLLVVDRDAKTLFFVNAETYKIVSTLRTGVGAQEVVVSPDWKTAFVSNFNDHTNTIMVIDVESREKIKDIKPTPYYKPHGMVVTPDNKTLYATCEANRAVVEMDIKSGKVLRSFETDQKLSHMLALSPDQKMIYTANAAEGTVTFIDLASGTRLGSTRSGSGCEGIAVTNDGSEVWATNRRSDTIVIIDTKTRKIIEEVECRGYPMRVMFTPDGARAVVACAARNYLNVFDTKTRESIDVVRTRQVPVGIDITPDGKTAFSANNGEPSVSIIDLDSMKEVHYFAIGKYPFSVRYVPAKK